MGWRHVAGFGLLGMGACFAGCANGGQDYGSDDATVGTDPDATMTQEGGDGGSSADSSPSKVDSSAPDTGKASDSGSAGQVDSAVIDTGSQIVDSGSVVDVILPDVFVPPGTTTCNYLGSTSLFAQYVAECLIFKSGATQCSAGCSASDCCGVLCQNNNNEAVCLPK
jgi:hypothetical protein